MSINEVGKIYQRPWGTYQTLSQQDNYQIKKITVIPGGKLSLQKHAQRAEHWIVIQGQATVQINDDFFELNINDTVYIPVGATHRLENKTQEPVAIIEIQVGDYLGEDDIVRLEDVYGRK